MPNYIIDANIFLQAYKATYPMDVVPRFWEKLKQLFDQNKIISIDKVKDEIIRNDDSLHDWVTNQLNQSAFESTQTDEIVLNFRKISQYIAGRSNHFTQAAINEFLSFDKADAWLIAYALQDIDNNIIVSYEASDPNCKRRVKIPDVCDHFNISYVNLIEMFRQLNETF